MNIALASPETPEVHALISAPDAYSDELTPPASRHRTALSALAWPNVLFAVARAADGQAIGCAAIVLLADYSELKRMYVLPSAHGRGVGSAILTFLEAEALTRSCRKLMLETGDKHHPAQRIYRANGFRECAPFGAYLSDPLSVSMEKGIAG